MFAFFALLCYNDMYAKNLRFSVRLKRGDAVLKTYNKGKKV